MKSARKQILIAWLACALVATAAAWHENGHYTIAFIAQEDLFKSKPEVIDWVLELLEPLRQECGEKKYPFLESAAWADKVRAQDWRLIMFHHFVSIPWFDEGAKKEEYFLPKFANVTYGIEETTSHLSSVVEDPLAGSKSIFGKGLSIRLLMHFIGDVHQPLHASDRITPKMPEGDAGGNLFPIKHFGEKQMDNLHFLWDTMFEDPKDNIKGFIDQSGYNLIKARSKDIMKRYSRGYFKAQMTLHPSPMDWALESNRIAQKFVYQNVTENGTISNDYADQGRIICQMRAALAGYRLADRLTQIYESLQKKNKLDRY